MVVVVVWFVGQHVVYVVPRSGVERRVQDQQQGPRGDNCVGDLFSRVGTAAQRSHFAVFTKSRQGTV